METNLQHEDLLIKLRAKLNEQKIKLWESPYILPDNVISQSLQDLAKQYATELSLDTETVLQALHELQLHSVDRSKANAEFKETGCATFRIRTTMPGEKPHVMKVQKKLDILGSELIKVTADEVGVTESRVKLIFNGKIINPTQNLLDQGLKNGAQIMALIMAERTEQMKKEDTMYMEMKTTRDDAMLLSEHVDDDFDDEDEYMKLEDQSGNTVELPASERRALMVGLALHERGRAAAKLKHYSLALLLLLEADKHFSECSSSILMTVDNWAVLQLDISWCYLCLRSLSSAADAADRLARAERAFKSSYGEHHERLIALKGTFANERVLFMRLFLLKGIVAYHQNRRAEAKVHLEHAEHEMIFLRVDDRDVATLIELGWSESQARTGLRVKCDPQLAHHYLTEMAQKRHDAREQHRQYRRSRHVGVCLDGSEVKQQLVEGLVGMGFPRRLAVLALRNSNNHVADAVRLIQEQPEMLEDSDLSSDETQSPSSDESLLEPDEKLTAQLEAMGYECEEVKTALRMSRNNVDAALDLLIAGEGHVTEEDPANPSTSSGAAAKKKQKKHKKDKKKTEREQALNRLTTTIRTEDDDHLDTSLVEEEEFLAQYKALL